MHTHSLHIASLLALPLIPNSSVSPSAALHSSLIHTLFPPLFRVPDILSNPIRAADFDLVPTFSRVEDRKTSVGLVLGGVAGRGSGC